MKEESDGGGQRILPLMRWKATEREKAQKLTYLLFLCHQKEKNLLVVGSPHLLTSNAYAVLFLFGINIFLSPPEGGLDLVINREGAIFFKFQNSCGVDAFFPIP